MEAFRFGDLPLELRAMIYRHLLVHRPLQRDGIDTSILSVCRQLKQEGEDVLYGENDVFVGINILHDGITLDARIPGIFARETTSADRHIGAGLHAFPVCLSRFRKVKVGISVEDGQNARQQEDLGFQSYLLAALLTQTHARMVTVTLEDGACELEVVDALRPLAALGPGIKVTFNGLPKEATAGLHTDSDLQESLLKSNAAEWYKTDAEITSLINKAGGPGALFGLESIVDKLRRQVYWLKTGGRDLSHAITNLKRMLDTGKRRMLETQQWRERAFPPKVKSPMALARRLAT